LCEAKLQDVEVNVDIIRNKLCSLNEDKAAGYDNLSALPRILNTIASEIALRVAMIFRKSLDTGSVPRDQNQNVNVVEIGEQQTSHPFLKRQ